VLYLPIRRVNGVWYQSGIRGQNEKTWETKKYFLPNTYLEARVKMPKGVLPASGGNKTGIWSAGWLTPARGIVEDYYYQSGANRTYWPHGGEVDWWETQWQGDWGRHMIWTTLIQANNSDPTRMTKVARYLGSNEVRGVPDWQTNWHVMSAHWFRDAGTIKWIFRVDGIQIANYQGGNFTGDPENWDRWADNKLVAKFQRAFWGGGHPAHGQPGSPFEKPFYLIFNSSVKGGGPIDQNDVEPNPANDGQALQIDWVRAYTPPR
jgi:hypothetical protein